MSNNKINYLNQSLDQIMSERFGQYSKYIIQDRALPDVRDGLKPVQRRILFSMVGLGLFYDQAFKKSARVVGDVIGKYHPHGDSSIYDALVRMSQNWKINAPLIEMHGNNGSIDDDPPAAMRYTEVRLSKISQQLFENIKKETVFFAPNFDDTEKEPTVFPALFPNLLVNGAKGIAAGYATEMPSHNLGEVINALIAKIKKPNIKLHSILKHINGPDFPTGGVVQGKQGIYEAFKTGKGRILISCKYQILYNKNKTSIIITEIPYGVVKAKLVRQIDEIRFTNKINGIKMVRDETDRNGLLIKIELENQKNAQAILNYLLTKTEMQIYYNYNNVAIRDKVPVQMGIIDLIDCYLQHQKKMQLKALNFNLNKNKKRLEIIQGLIKVAKNINMVINVIKSATNSKKGVISALIANFNFTNLQAEAIAELHLYRLSQTDQSSYYQEEEKLMLAIKETKIILESDAKFDDYLIVLLKNLKKEYATPRKTIIEDAKQPVIVDMEVLIKYEQVWIGISKEGYIKKFSNQIYKNNKLDDYVIRAGDALIYLQFINTKYKLLIFTSNGRYIFLPAHKIMTTKFQDVGKHINDFVTIDQKEHIVNVIAVKDFEINAYITLVTKNSKGKRVKISDFEVSRYTKSYQAIKLIADDKLISVAISNGFKKLIFITKKGLANKYPETQLPIQSLNSTGVKTITLSSDDELVTLATGTDYDVLGMVSHRGGAKRIKISTIETTKKLSKGRIIFRIIKNNPHIIIAAKVVMPQTAIIFSKNKLNIYKFNEVNITSDQEGFSLLNTLNHGVMINTFEIIDKDNNYFKEANSSNYVEDKFKEAEKTIDEIPKISIDNLLKDEKK